MKIKRWWIAAALTPPSLVLLLAAWLGWFSPTWEKDPHDLPFDSAAWKARSRDAGIIWPTRLRMADDLQASGILKGKTRAEVRDLLGEDDSSLYDASQGRITYLLGPERGPGLGLNLELLALHFGGDGRVSRWEIRTH
jgi:hypothetical protein